MSKAASRSSTRRRSLRLSLLASPGQVRKIEGRGRSRRLSQRINKETLPEAPLLLPNMKRLPHPIDGKTYKKELLNLVVDFNDRLGVINAIESSENGPNSRAMNKWFPNKNMKFGSKTIYMLLGGCKIGSKEWLGRAMQISNSEYGPELDQIFSIFGLNYKDEDISREHKPATKLADGAEIEQSRTAIISPDTVINTPYWPDGTGDVDGNNCAELEALPLSAHLCDKGRSLESRRREGEHHEGERHDGECVQGWQGPQRQWPSRWSSQSSRGKL